MSPRFAGFADVQDSTIVPAGTYQVSVDSLEATTSSTGKLMYKGGFRIVEPKLFENVIVWEQFTVGTDDDPGAEDPQTWLSPKAVAVRQLKQLFGAAKLDMRLEVDQLVAQVVGSHVTSVVKVETQAKLNRDGTENRYAGNEKNRVTRFAPLDQGGVGAAPPKTAANSVPRAVQPPQRPGAGVVARPSAVQPPARPPGIAGGAPATAKRAEMKIPCSICDEQVPRSQWAEHEAGHAPAEAEA
jgi:hypothetical protein